MRKKICNKCGAIADKNHVCNRGRYVEAKKDLKATHQVLNTYKWQQKRDFIKNRDRYFCQRCFYKLGIINNENLEVHHIKNRHDFPELIFEDSNLITICGDCNKFYIGQNELDFDWNNGEYNPSF